MILISYLERPKVYRENSFDRHANGSHVNAHVKLELTLPREAARLCRQFPKWQQAAACLCVHILPMCDLVHCLLPA